MTIAPPAIVKITAEFQARADRPKSYRNGGVVGDAQHMSPPEGYHVSARDENFRWGAYSLETPRDRAGGKLYPDYASAWDLSMDQADMILVTTRLITAAKAKDPRLNCLAEIAGTTNGTTVHAYYVNTSRDDPNNTGGWAASHTGHVHLSISRDDCNNYAALKPILDVICGVPLEEDMPTADELAKAVWDYQIQNSVDPATGKPTTAPAHTFLTWEVGQFKAAAQVQSAVKAAVAGLNLSGVDPDALAKAVVEHLDISVQAKP